MKYRKIEVRLYYLDYLKLMRIARVLQVSLDELINEGVQYIIRYYYRILSFSDLYPI